MSRAYRIRVRESLHRMVRAADHIDTQLELLPILPADEMAALVTAELQRRGFQSQGGQLVRQAAGLTVRVEPATGTVTISAESRQHVDIEGERQGVYYEETGSRAASDRLREALQRELESQARDKQADLQKQVSNRLEAALADIRQELDQITNRVTAEALKRKAAQLGRIKELSDDPQSGSLTIVLEV